MNCIIYTWVCVRLFEFILTLTSLARDSYNIDICTMAHAATQPH